MEAGRTLANVRSHVASDHDALAAKAEALARLTDEHDFRLALVEARRLRNRFVLHVAGVADTLQSLELGGEALQAGLRRDRNEVEASFLQLADSLERQDANAAGSALRRMSALITQHATWEMVTLQ